MSLVRPSISHVRNKTKTKNKNKKENGRKLYIWIGMNTPSKVLQDLFGTGFIESVDTTMVRRRFSFFLFFRVAEITFFSFLQDCFAPTVHPTVQASQVPA